VTFFFVGKEGFEEGFANFFGGVFGV